MSLKTIESNDAGGLTLTGAAAASDSDAECDEYDDAGKGVITSGYGLGADEFSPSSSGPTVPTQ